MPSNVPNGELTRLSFLVWPGGLTTSRGAYTLQAGPPPPAARALHVTSVSVSADTAGLIVSAFLASAVEFVEALTIVLAMGVTRGWRSTLTGVALALVALAAITAGAGYALAEWLPESVLQLIVGTLLLI